MAAVNSVQKHQITIPSGTSSATSATLDPAVTLDDCIPFVTSRVTDDNGAIHACYAVKAEFITGPDRVQVSTGINTSREVVCEVTVVEFNSTLVTVQNGTKAITGTNTSTQIDVSVDRDQTFLYHTWSHQDSETNYGATNIRGILTTDILGEFSRQNSAAGGQIDITWWLAEGITGTPPFDVQHVILDLESAQTTNTADAPGDFTAVTAAKTMLIGSWKSPEENFSNAEHTVDTLLNVDGDTITKNRSGSTDFVFGQVQLVSFTGSETVYRGTIVGTDGSDVDSVGPVNSAGSMVHAAGATGSFTSGSFAGTAATDCPDAHCGLTLTDTDVTCTHGTTGADTGTLSWEVIDFDLGAPPAGGRRIMVIG
jgi:hypothetical protein